MSDRRFWSKVAIGPGCWEWQACRLPSGYGMLGSGGKPSRSVYAHRTAWTLVYGEIPPGLQVRHTCDNPPCVRPSHLRLGTQKDNMADKTARGRHWQTKKTHCKRGHEFTPENTYRYKTGYRSCRECMVLRAAGHIQPTKETK